MCSPFNTPKMQIQNMQFLILYINITFFVIYENQYELWEKQVTNQ